MTSFKHTVYEIWYIVRSIINFNMNQSVDKTEYFLDSLITRKLLKLVNKISNQFTYWYY